MEFYLCTIFVLIDFVSLMEPVIAIKITAIQFNGL